MNTLQLGTARIDISPHDGRIKQEGYLLERYLDGIHDPIFAKGLVLEQGDTRVGILCCDLLWLPREFTDPVALEIERRTGIPPANLMIACSHTHSGPQVTDNVLVTKEEAYVESLSGKLAEAMVQAGENLTEAHVRVAKGHEDRISVNSRFLFEDGTIAWRAPFEGEKATSTGPIDPEAGVISFRDADKKVIATLYNYACHASAGGCGQISADYPGAASERIEAELGGMALYTRGSCGNIHPTMHASEMGVKLGGEVVQALRSNGYSSGTMLASVREEIALPLRELDPHEINEVDLICDKTNPESAEGRKIYFRTCYAAFQALRERTDTLRTFIQAIRVGDAVLAGIPGEQFVQDGLGIKEQSPCPNTFVVNLANDTIGYIPTRKAYDEGGYQTWIGACNIAPEAGEMIVEKVLKLIERVA